jgi:hypothetical protein
MRARGQSGDGQPFRLCRDGRNVVGFASLVFLMKSRSGVIEEGLALFLAYFDIDTCGVLAM